MSKRAHEPKLEIMRSPAAHKTGKPGEDRLHAFVFDPATNRLAITSGLEGYNRGAEMLGKNIDKEDFRYKHVLGVFRKGFVTFASHHLLTDEEVKKAAQALVEYGLGNVRASHTRAHEKTEELFNLAGVKKKPDVKT